MEEKKDIKAAGFVVYNEEGGIHSAGVINFREQLHGVMVEISVFKQEQGVKMMKTRPAGGFRIVDDFSGGRIQLFTSELSVNYLALTSAIDTLREKYEIPLSEECRKEAAKLASGIPVKPSSVKS